MITFKKALNSKKIAAIVIALITLAVCAVSYAGAVNKVSAVEGNVKVSVGKTEVKPGDKFALDVYISDIPDTGANYLDFAVKIDSGLVTGLDVKEGALSLNTGATEREIYILNELGIDPNTVTDGNSEYSCFLSTVTKDPYDDDVSFINFYWLAAYAEDTYWLRGGGVFATITGTVSSKAANGTTISCEIVAKPTLSEGSNQEPEIGIGYIALDDDVYSYDYTLENGYVKVNSSGVTLPTTTSTAKPTTSTAKPTTSTGTGTTVTTTTGTGTTVTTTMGTGTTTIPAESVPTEEPYVGGALIWGDVDLNHEIGLNDAISLLKYVSLPVGAARENFARNIADAYNAKFDAGTLRDKVYVDADGNPMKLSARDVIKVANVNQFNDGTNFGLINAADPIQIISKVLDSRAKPFYFNIIDYYKDPANGCAHFVDPENPGH